MAAREGSKRYTRGQEEAGVNESALWQYESETPESKEQARCSRRALDARAVRAGIACGVQGDTDLAVQASRAELDAATAGRWERENGRMAHVAGEEVGDGGK